MNAPSRWPPPRRTGNVPGRCAQPARTARDQGQPGDWAASLAACTEGTSGRADCPEGTGGGREGAIQHGLPNPVLRAAYNWPPQAPALVDALRTTIWVAVGAYPAGSGPPANDQAALARNRLPDWPCAQAPEYAPGRIGWKEYASRVTIHMTEVPRTCPWSTPSRASSMPGTASARRCHT